MNWLVSGLATFLCVVALQSQAQLKLEGENLLLTPPVGFKVSKDTREGVSVIVWVPNSETVRNWSEMVKVVIFPFRPERDPQGFIEAVRDGQLEACNGGAPAPIARRSVNGYPAATMTFRCPIVPSVGTPEVNRHLAIKANKAFYLVQRAARSVGALEQMERVGKYMAEVSACEAGSQQHPCPDLVPHRR